MKNKSKAKKITIPSFSYKMIEAFVCHKNISMGISAFGVAFVVAFLAFSILVPVDSSNADSNVVTTTIKASDYYLNIISHDIALNLDSNITSDTDIASDTITTKTNAPKGYKLYVSMENDADCNKTTGECDGSGTGSNIVPGNALYKDGDSTISPYISPASGTFSAPSTLGVNTWGISDSSVSTGQEDTFFAVPLLPNFQLIQSTDSANTSGVTKTLYYGAKADYTMPTGSYKNNILYTAVANASASGDEHLTISPDSTKFRDGGDSVTIVTSLFTNYPLEVSDVTAYIGGKICPVTSVSTNTTTGTKQITCTTPSQDTIGAKNVYVSIPRFSWSYTLTNGYTILPTFWSIIYMQEMTTAVCNTVYTPGKYYGSNATMISNGRNYTATADGSTQVPETTVYDYRGHDGTGTLESPATGSNRASYKIRKLADGNCYMMDNLALTLSNSTEIEVASQSTGLARDTKWTPPSSYVTTPTVANDSTTGQWYYSWFAATLGWTTAFQPATYSICPVGWKMVAQGAAAKSYLSIARLFGKASGEGGISSGNLEFIEGYLGLGLYGYYSSSTLYSNGSSGYYWAGVTGYYGTNSYAGYQFSYFSGGSSANVHSTGSTYDGKNVRCVNV